MTATSVPMMRAAMAHAGTPTILRHVPITTPAPATFAPVAPAQAAPLTVMTSMRVRMIPATRFQDASMPRTIVMTTMPAPMKFVCRQPAVNTLRIIAMTIMNVRMTAVNLLPVAHTPRTTAMTAMHVQMIPATRFQDVSMLLMTAMTAMPAPMTAVNLLPVVLTLRTTVMT